MHSSNLTADNPKYHIARAVRVASSTSSVGRISADKSKFCKRSGSASSATEARSANSDVIGSVGRKRVGLSSLDSTRMKNGSADDAMLRSQTRQTYFSPPLHPKQVKEFLVRMREDEARCTKMHEKVCESKGIAFHPTKRLNGRRRLSMIEQSCSTSQRRPVISCSSTPSRNVRSPMLRRSMGPSEIFRPDPLPVRGKSPTPYGRKSDVQPHALATAATTISGARGDKRGENGAGGVPKEAAARRQRPVISVNSTTSVSRNGVTATAANNRRVQQGRSTTRQQVRKQQSPSQGTPLHQDSPGVRQPPRRSLSGAISPSSVSPCLKNCRTETAPYIETPAGRQSEVCSPVRLDYDVVDESSPGLVQ
ncbi:hypothetical protein MOQ_004371 [Trypanosoma cruzi marinkellei]|uniref:Uncharacterized protein n=1 Tax=Trypanosoma cruzi marinkellei TaxID=85056 RepID=K2NS07_TRYCR|nr:hypothetical protein MOQ_004371 [Trypanosoma cruzi marinkellei]